MNVDPRFLRQVIVPHVGEDGQRALTNARACVRGTAFSNEVEARYLEAAGVGLIESDVDEEGSGELPSGLELAHPITRAFASASHAAVKFIASTLKEARRST